ncbi:MAG: stress response translation initiation inhibitor YciH [archaeon]
MPEICQVCGLPKELCICQELAREKQRIKVYVLKRKYGKLMTVVEGFDEKEIDAKELTKGLKAKCACGGTFKEGHVELQGDHRNKVKNHLVSLGFSESMVEVR